MAQLNETQNLLNKINEGLLNKESEKEAPEDKREVFIFSSKNHYHLYKIKPKNNKVQEENDDNFQGKVKVKREVFLYFNEFFVWYR